MSSAVEIAGREMITCQEAARIYGCTMGYIRRLARDGKLTAQSVGPMWFVDKSELLQAKRLCGSKAKGFAAG